MAKPQEHTALINKQIPKSVFYTLLGIFAVKDIC